MQAVRGMKNAPRPCRRKTSARAGSVSDHRTYHTLLWTTRKQHGQRGPKMKWSGAETAKNGRKYSKKVSGACSHPKGSGVRSSSGPPKWKSPWYLPAAIFCLTTERTTDRFLLLALEGYPFPEGVPFIVYSPAEFEAYSPYQSCLSFLFRAAICSISSSDNSKSNKSRFSWM